MERLANTLKIAAIIAAILALSAAPAAAQRVKDIARVKAAQINVVSGLGLVRGLSGSGDGDSKELRRMLSNYYRRNNILMKPEDLDARNVAVVEVIAKIPADYKEGMLLDVEVVSTGGAKSLKGGTLSIAWLSGPDQKKKGEYTTYIIATGPVDVPKGGALNRGVVINGGQVVTEIPVTYHSKDDKGRDVITWIIEQPDGRTAVQVAKAFREAYRDLGLDPAWRTKLAKAVNTAEIVVQIPPEYKDRHMEFIAVLESRPVIGIDVEARVVINKADGSVAINGNVRVSPCLVTVDGVQVLVPKPTTPPPRNEKVVAVADPADVGVALTTLKNVLNTIGVSNETLIKVILRLRDAGALHGKLIVK